MMQGQQAYHGPHPQYIPVASNTPYTTLYTVSGTPIQIVNVNPNPSDGTYPKYKAKAARILGLLQIVIGLLILISQIIVTAIHADGYQGLSGFWASGIFILAGAFGVQSSKSKSQCTVVTTMVLSIIAAVFCTSVISQGAVGIARQWDCYYVSYYGSHCGYLNSHARVSVAFHAIMLVLGVAEGVVAIVAAVYCCQGCCCHSRPGVVLSPPMPGITTVPVGSGQVQVTAVQYQQAPPYYAAAVPAVRANAYPQQQPSAYPQQPGAYSQPPSAYPQQPSAYPNEAGAALPAYTASTPPPAYKEKE